MFIQNQDYKRTDLHEQLGGQRQGGISTPANQPLILLFTSDAGEQYGYSDSWHNGLFHYVGEGQQGKMELIRGNAAIHNHITDGKDLHLFSYVRKGFVRYVSQMVCTGYHTEEGSDSTGNKRQIIVFELTPLNDFIEVGVSNEPNDSNQHTQAQMDKLSLENLRVKAQAASMPNRTPIERKQDYYYRSLAIKLYAQKRACGICEGCNQQAPFKTKEGKPYLEVHHIRRLSDGGPDDPMWVVAICPNCHRRAHYAEDMVLFNKHLTHVVQKKELASTT